MKYKFTNAENFDIQTVPPGEYRYRVAKTDAGIQDKGASSGCDFIDVKLLIFGKDGERLTMVGSKLIFYEKMYWKIDTFLKSANYMVNGQTPLEGDELDVKPEELVGLRGWCRLGVREYEKEDKTKGKTNEVTAWLTDKPKLPRGEGGLVQSKKKPEPEKASPAPPVETKANDDDPDWD